MTRAKGALGAYGERVAARLLHDTGMCLLDRNWRSPRGELDIVARAPDGTLVFCEVKTRRSERFGPPSAAVGAAKVRRLRALAAAWLAAHPDQRGTLRFDIIGVYPQPRGAAVTEHLRGAF